MLNIKLWLVRIRVKRTSSWVTSYWDSSKPFHFSFEIVATKSDPFKNGKWCTLNERMNLDEFENHKDHTVLVKWS